MTEASRHGGQPSPPTPRVRLVDVAREAGLSKTTVSAALNGTGRLSPEVREKARETARRMGYRPNATARHLRAGRARLIGYVVGEFAATPWATFLESPYFARLTGVTAATALRRGYAVVLLPAGSLQSEWADLSLDAVVVADPVADDPVVEGLLAAGIPVFTDRSVEGLPGAYWVDVDAAGAVREALDHLHGQGARRPVVVVPDSTTRFHAEVYAAHREWCAAHGLPERVVRVGEPGNAPVVRGVEAALAADGRGRPDALLVVAEASPPLVLEAARRQGYAVPDDLLVVLVSEDATALLTDPPVTTLSLRPEAVAEAGVEHLVAVLEHGRREPTGTLVATRLDVRASSLRR